MATIAVPAAGSHLDRSTVDRVKHSLRLSTAEGVASGAFFGLGDHYLVAFAVALQTSSLELGILTSVPAFLASLAQLGDTRLIRLLRSRRAVILTFAFAQALMLLPILSLAIVPRGHPGWWLILFTIIYTIFGALVSPAWGSIMAEVVPGNLRGRYFALRGSLATLSSVVAFMLGGLVLNSLVQGALWGFAIVFALALGTRLISWVLLRTLYEPRNHDLTQHTAVHAAHAPAFDTKNLTRYLAFLFCMAFAVNIASPFFTVYQLRDLHWSYLTFALLETASSAATLLTLTYWGRIADRIGNLRLLVLASSLIPLVPLLWLASTNYGYIALIQLFSGLAWAGFNLCSVNYLFDATSGETRTKYLAYFNAGCGIATGAGALLGGVLLPHLPALLGYPVLTLFLISGLLRLAVAALFLPRLHEVRRVSLLPAAQLFHVLSGGRSVTHRASHRRHLHLFPHRGANL